VVTEPRVGGRAGPRGDFFGEVARKSAGPAHDLIGDPTALGDEVAVGTIRLPCFLIVLRPEQPSFPAARPPGARARGVAIGTPQEKRSWPGP
jgi:hypothetical protein